MNMFNPDRNPKNQEQAILEVQEIFASVYPLCDEHWKVDALDKFGKEVSIIVQAPYEDAVRLTLQGCGYSPIKIKEHSFPNT